LGSEEDRLGKYTPELNKVGSDLLQDDTEKERLMIEREGPIESQIWPFQPIWSVQSILKTYCEEWNRRTSE